MINDLIKKVEIEFVNNNDFINLQTIYEHQ